MSKPENDKISPKIPMRTTEPGSALEIGWVSGDPNKRDYGRIAKELAAELKSERPTEVAGRKNLFSRDAEAATPPGAAYSRPSAVPRPHAFEGGAAFNRQHQSALTKAAAVHTISKEAPVVASHEGKHSHDEHKSPKVHAHSGGHGSNAGHHKPHHRSAPSPVAIVERVESAKEREAVSAAIVAAVSDMKSGETLDRVSAKLQNEYGEVGVNRLSSVLQAAKVTAEPDKPLTSEQLSKVATVAEHAHSKDVKSLHTAQRAEDALPYAVAAAAREKVETQHALKDPVRVIERTQNAEAALDSAQRTAYALRQIAAGHESVADSLARVEREGGPAAAKALQSAMDKAREGAPAPADGSLTPKQLANAVASAEKEVVASYDELRKARAAEALLPPDVAIFARELAVKPAAGPTPEKTAADASPGAEKPSKSIIVQLEDVKNFLRQMAKEKNLDGLIDTGLAGELLKKAEAEPGSKITLRGKDHRGDAVEVSCDASQLIAVAHGPSIEKSAIDQSKLPTLMGDPRVATAIHDARSGMSTQSIEQAAPPRAETPAAPAKQPGHPHKKEARSLGD